jgi:NusA-like KH domain protein
MRTTFDITSIQQINLFSRITGVQAKNCFNYSNSLIFVVDSFLLNRAIGRGGENVRMLSSYLKKKVKIIRTPQPDELERFILTVIYPLKFKSLKNENGSVTISAGQQSKASLIGRNHSRINELIEIVKQYFDVKDIRII